MIMRAEKVGAHECVCTSEMSSVGGRSAGVEGGLACQDLEEPPHIMRCVHKLRALSHAARKCLARLPRAPHDGHMHQRFDLISALAVVSLPDNFKQCVLGEGVADVGGGSKER